MLRDGEAALYNPFAKKMREAAKRRRDMALMKSGKAVVDSSRPHVGLKSTKAGVRARLARTKTKGKTPL